MEKPIRSIEFETMLLLRYSLASRSRRGGIRLDRSAYTLLSRLQGEGPMSIGQLSDALVLEASTLRRQTAAMRGAGLVERIPDPDGGIARRFRITAEGERRLDEERTDSVAALDAIMADWTADEVAAFAAFLERFNSDIERFHGRPWPRPSCLPDA
ncbi:MarR family winged helix-turn-helix transcriptional regulator [Nocardia australiensis]|uniref:MarR family winged helix-turn-helix transcriptional regulator n=1 Tax=Nocardia australiensis TaxID=2887191 RepID=UPI001D14996F|nr:MarR family transcriptional regulator [Nocardia australiensis]